MPIVKIQVDENIFSTKNQSRKDSRRARQQEVEAKVQLVSFDALCRALVDRREVAC